MSRLLFVAKRRPQQRDLIERPYGRYHFLPCELARLGHHVEVALLGHGGDRSVSLSREGVVVSSCDVRTLGPAGAMRELRQRAHAFAPDWIVGCSDTWYGWIARDLARRCGARLAVDAYDDYEAYMPWNLPVHWQWRRAVRSADLVTAAGPQLAERLDRHRPGRDPTRVVPMAADPMFRPFDRVAARAALGLPTEAPLVGYCGGWARNRGTDLLIDAFRKVRAIRPDTRLVLTGRPPAYAVDEPGVLTLGYVEDSRLPLVLASLDVACVLTADTAFGRSSYPAKLCEAMACQVPVVATATAPVRWMLRDDVRHLVPLDDASAMAARVVELFGQGPVAYPGLPSWSDSALLFDAALAGSTHR